jgi:hypothetical protein
MRHSKQLQTDAAIPGSYNEPRPAKDAPMLALLIASAIAASLLVELGLLVAREWTEASQFRHDDERQMNGAFKRTSGGA